jgi:hypothetical protein
MCSAISARRLRGAVESTNCDGSWLQRILEI